MIKKIIIIAISIISIFVVMLNVGEFQVETPTIDSLGEDASQTELIYAAKEDYKSKKYSIKTPFVINDLFNRNKLSAYVIFPIDEEATYSYTVTGKDKNTNFSINSDVSQDDNMVVPIIGLYENYNNKVSIDINYKSGEKDQLELEIQTDKIDDNIISKLDIDTSYSDIDSAVQSLEGGLLFTAMGNGYDVNGDIRVALGQKGVQTANPISLNYDGSYLQMYEDHVESIDFTGRTITSYEMVDGYEPHHDQMSAVNGYTYVLTSPGLQYEEGKDIYNEGHIAVYKTGKSGKPIAQYDLNTDFIGNKVNDAGTNQSAGTDLMHLNSVDYYEPTNTVIVSSQTMNLIAGFDADTFELQWTTADSAGQGNNDSKKHILKKLKGYVASNGQHNVHITSNPKFDDNNDDTIELQMFDNLYCVDENGESIFAELDSTIGERKECSSPDSKQLVYRIDPKKMTVDTIYEQTLEGIRSATQASWFQSPDYKYNTISYTQIGTVYITDEENNIIFTAANPEITDPLTYSTYRARILSNDQITSNIEYGENI